MFAGQILALVCTVEMALAGIFPLVPSIFAVFFASIDPDGLESTALVVSEQNNLTGLSPEEGDPEAIGTGTFEYEALLPDYSMG